MDNNNKHTLTQHNFRYVSYSEIEVQCRTEDNINFNILKSMTIVDDKLVGVFVDDENDKDSAICVFSMEQIQLTFWWNIDRCRSGTDTIGLPHIGRDSKCINVSLDLRICIIFIKNKLRPFRIAINRLFKGSEYKYIPKSKQLWMFL